MNKNRRILPNDENPFTDYNSISIIIIIRQYLTSNAMLEAAILSSTDHVPLSDYSRRQACRTDLQTVRFKPYIV